MSTNRVYVIVYAINGHMPFRAILNNGQIKRTTSSYDECYEQVEMRSRHEFRVCLYVFKDDASGNLYVVDIRYTMPWFPCQPERECMNEN